MGETLTWTCRCGATQALLKAGIGTRIVCYCQSCRAFNRYLDAMETIDAAGGSDLLQTAPDAVEIIKGVENLRVLRLTQKGPYRWYTGCCNTPMANTLPTRAVPFTTLLVPQLDHPERAGPVVARVHRRDATGHVEGDAGSVWKVLRPFFARVLRAYATGAWRRSPFFDESGQPRARLDHLDAAALDRAYGREPDA